MNPGVAVLDEMPERWARWRLFRNRRGTRTLLWIVLSLYPTFGVLDWVLAPRSALSLLWGTRFIVAAVTLIMFRVVRTSVFDRHPDAIVLQAFWSESPLKKRLDSSAVENLVAGALVERD